MTECDACHRMMPCCVTQMTSAGEGSFCHICRSHNACDQCETCVREYTAMRDRAEAAERELALQREADEADPLVQRCERYAAEAGDLAERLMAAYGRRCYDAGRERAERDEAPWRRIRTLTHGSCCTCQACGQFYDDCRCDLEVVHLKADNARLRALLREATEAWQCVASCNCSACRDLEKRIDKELEATDA